MSDVIIVLAWCSALCYGISVLLGADSKTYLISYIVQTKKQTIIGSTEIVFVDGEKPRFFGMKQTIKAFYNIDEHEDCQVIIVSMSRLR